MGIIKFTIVNYMYKINSIKLAINYHTIYHVISFFMADRDRNIAIDRNIGY